MIILEKSDARQPQVTTGMATEFAGSALIIVNPTAGTGDTKTGTDVETYCERVGMAVEMVATTRCGEATQVAMEKVRDWPALRWVVVVGGDGTVREVAEGVARGLGRWPGGATGSTEASPALFIVPAGTGNSLYRALWGEAPWTEAMAQVLRGDCRIRALDLLRFAELDRGVFLGASVGLTARITELAAEMRHVPGRQRYWLAAATALSTLEPVVVDVSVDGGIVYRGSVNIVAVGGGRYRAGIFQLLPRSILDDGQLDVCVVGELGSDAIEPFAALVTSGEHLHHPAVRYARGRRVTVTRCDGKPLLIEVDGDVQNHSSNRLTLEIVPGAVPMLAPIQPLAG